MVYYAFTSQIRNFSGETLINTARVVLPMDKFKDAIAKALAKQTSLKQDQVLGMLTIPPDPNLGDVAFPCFALSKELKKSPPDIAKDLASKITVEGIQEVKSTGPYLNFFIDPAAIANAIIPRILKEKDHYGSIMSKKKALIEHTSINPNASPHLGRARNAILGDAVARLLKFHGYNTEVHYYVNDVGKQIALLTNEVGDSTPEFSDMLEIYQRASKKMEEDEKVEQAALETLNKLENGDEEIRKKFHNVVQICVKGQAAILFEMGIKYDHFQPESEFLFDGSTDKILKKLEKTGKVFTDEDNRKVLDQSDYNLAMKEPVLVLTRGDGTSLYILRDLAYGILKNKRKNDLNVMILGEDHKLYAKQFAAALDMLNEQAPTPIHYSFVLLDEGKMSTRKGTVILLEDFMQEAREKAEAEIKKRNPDLDNIHELSRSIGYGAIKFSILKVSAEKNVTFNWENALSFEGETGPYIQYSHARIHSIFRKHGEEAGTGNLDLLKHDAEIALLKSLASFADATTHALKTYHPHIIAHSVFDVASKFNEFYHACPVLQDDEKLQAARLQLLEATRIVLKTGLELLGIQAPERM